MSSKSRWVNHNTVAQKYNTSKKLSSYEQKPGESIEHYYNRLVMQADKRMQRLEKYQNETGYENILKWAYGTAQHDIEALYGSGTNRFKHKLPTNKKGDVIEIQAQARINAVKKFLESPTSTKQGINKVYGAKAQALNSKFGTKFTWQSLATFFEKGIADKIAFQEGGSDTIMRAIGKMQRHSNDKYYSELKDKIAEAEVNNKRIELDVVDQKALELLNTGVDFSNFF